MRLQRRKEREIEKENRRLPRPADFIQKIVGNTSRGSGHNHRITIVKFTQLCSKFPPTAFLNFACDG